MFVLTELHQCSYGASSTFLELAFGSRDQTGISIVFITLSLLRVRLGSPTAPRLPVLRQRQVHLSKADQSRLVAAYLAGDTVRSLASAYTLPSAMRSLTVPATSSIGTLGSTRC
jgi:hypothetical protein